MLPALEFSLADVTSQTCFFVFPSRFHPIRSLWQRSESLLERWLKLGVRQGAGIKVANQRAQHPHDTLRGRLRESHQLHRKAAAWWELIREFLTKSSVSLAAPLRVNSSLALLKGINQLQPPWVASPCANRHNIYHCYLSSSFRLSHACFMSLPGLSGATETRSRSGRGSGDQVRILQMSAALADPFMVLLRTPTGQNSADEA